MKPPLPMILACLLGGCLPRTVADHAAPCEPPSPAAIRPFTFGSPDLVLLVTGGGNGRMEMCNCSGPMAGGLARRGGLVVSYRQTFPNTLLLDSGDAFWIVEDDIRDEYVFRGHEIIGYDVQVLGDQEWAAGPDVLGKSLLPPVKYLSTTVGFASEGAGRLGPGANGGEQSRPFAKEIRDPERVEGRFAVRDSEHPPSPLAREVRRTFSVGGGEVKLAFLSDLRRRDLLFFPRERLAGLSFAADDELPRRARELHQQGYLVAIVCHGPPEEWEMAGRSCAADLIIAGHASKSVDKVQTVAGRPAVVVAGPEHVGVLGLKFAGGAIAQTEFRLELVDERWPLDRRLLQNYQAYCHVAMRRALEGQRPAPLAYVGSDQCGRCHAEQYQFWRQTPHARAYQSLEKVQRTDDPSCLTCHTTGFGMAGGFYTAAKTPTLAGVNCQDCHHADMAGHPSKSARMQRVDENYCEACHSTLTSPRFNFKTYLPRAQCPPIRRG